MIRSGFLERAPFSWIGITFRYGDRNQKLPDYEEVDPQDGELPLTIELDMKDLQGAPKDRVAAIFRGATTRSLIDLGSRYGLPVADLRAALERSKG